MKTKQDPNYISSEDIDSEALILKRLAQGPLCVNAATKLLTDNGVYLARSTAKGIFWKLVEEEKAFFNDSWLLEATNQMKRSDDQHQCPPNEIRPATDEESIPIRFEGLH